MYIEDVDLCWQAQERGREVWYFGSLSARHAKGHASAAISDDMLAALFRSTRLWYEKNRFGRMNFFSRGLTRLGLWAWERMARLRNRLRARKSAQP
jgi:GT2 family glycosyltransferase